MDMRFDKELAAAIPGWESEFGNSTHANQAPAANPIDMNKPVPPTLCELLREFSTAMLITHSGDRGMRGRPMIILEVEASGRMWFIASAESALAHEIAEDTQVHLAFQKDHTSYLSLNGRAAQVDDREKIAQLWSDSFNPWFPEGKTDPKISLISVTPHDMEYWHHRQPPISGSWDAKVAYVHGTKPEEAA